MTYDSDYPGTDTAVEAAHDILENLDEEWEEFTDAGKRGTMKQAMKVLETDMDD